MSDGNVAARRHIVGLDVWRAALIIGGVILHGSAGLPSTGLFRAVDLISQTFRMGAFYAIAGVLSALAMADRSPEAWLRRRLHQLGFPLAFGMATIPPAIWLMATTFGWPGTPPLPFDWHHLWFLVGLIVYSTVVYALRRSNVDNAIQSRMEAMLGWGRLRTSTVLLMTAVATAILFGVAPIVMKATMSAPVFEAFRTLQLVAGYLPMFLLGYAVGRSPTLQDALLMRWRLPALIVAGVAAAYLIWFVAIAPELDAVGVAMGTYRLRFIAAAICPPAAFVLILRSALAIRSVPPIISRIARASYTIYLLHLPVAVAINLALRPFAFEPHLSYAFAVAGSAMTSFAFHEHVVRRSALFALLLNGTPPDLPILRRVWATMINRRI